MELRGSCGPTSYNVREEATEDYEVCGELRTVENFPKTPALIICPSVFFNTPASKLHFGSSSNTGSISSAIRDFLSFPISVYHSSSPQRIPQSRPPRPTHHLPLPPSP